MTPALAIQAVRDALPERVGHREVVLIDPQTFGLWTAYARCGMRSYVKCACGTERWVANDSLRRGISRSCGCARESKPRAGGTFDPPPLKLALSAAAKLERYEPELNTGCWLWTGSVNEHGYGGLFFLGKRYSAHRFFYEQLKGPIPSGLLLRHKCDTPTCVNPAHLLPGTTKDNAADALERDRLRTFPAGEEHPNRKLSEDAVRAIRADPRLSRLIALDYGVTLTTIQSIKHRETWKHVA